jgi:carbon-monoxide dehydrogenase medium subunit
VVVRGPDGERRLPIDDLFVDLYTTALQQGELITAIVIPLPQGGSGSAYEKLERQVGDFAIVGVAVSIAVQDGTIASARIAVTNMAATAVRAPAAEAALIGQAPGAPAFAVAAALIATGLEPWDELRGSAAYKRSVLPAVARRALLRAWTRAESAPVERVA